MKLHELALGQVASVVRAFSTADLEEYAALAGDENPIYTDLASARRAGLPDLAVPGPLIGGMFSKLLGTELPGRGTNWMKQRLTFAATGRPGEHLTATVEVIRLRPEKGLVNLRTTCTGDGGRLIATGEVLVLVKEMETAPTTGPENARSSPSC